MNLAIIKTGGKQYLVKEGDQVKIEKLDKKEGQKKVFDRVLLLEKDQELKIGQPFLEQTQVEAKVLEQGKREKVVIFKHRPKKRYTKKKGHRQPYTKVEITTIKV